MTTTPALLREKYPQFSYQNYTYSWAKGDLTATYQYQLSPSLSFHHQVIFPTVPQENVTAQPPGLIDNLVFHLGLIEAFSYWKLTASQIFTINGGYLDNLAVQFWHDLLISGMGEYFYANQIDFTSADFIQLQVKTPTLTKPPIQVKKFHHQRLSAVFLGGGKDSAVMLSLLQRAKEKFVNFIVQPASPAANTMATLTHRPTYTARRQFDPQLFALNRQGYLNGHVPFSASVAFLSVLAGVLYDFDAALVGNEDSSNEPTLNWKGCPINHQYSKSAHFEQTFQTYCRHNLCANFDYFSPLRSLSELKIAQLFAQLPQFFSIFRSCNRGQRQNQWCERCPKCLFVFLILYPFIEEELLTTKIFSHNLLADTSLLPELAKLLGLTSAKPFECVGTRDEAQAAFYLSITKIQTAKKPLPPLLAQLSPEVLSARTDWTELTQKLLAAQAPNFAPTWAQPLLL
jgi:hypothetical protein